MHAEVLRDEPGDCPICGMALEPTVVTVEETNPELADMTRRFWVSLALSFPLLAAAMADMLPGQPVHRFFGERLHGIEMALATPVVLWCGWPFFVRGWMSVVRRRLNMFTLIGIGVGAAYLESIAATLVPGVFPPSFREAGQVAVYYEAAAVIVTLVLLGQVLELRARSRTSSAMRALLGSGPQDARGSCMKTATRKTFRFPGRCRGSASRTARRKSSGRRHRAGGIELRGRVDGHRRADAGGETDGGRG